MAREPSIKQRTLGRIEAKLAGVFRTDPLYRYAYVNVYAPGKDPSPSHSGGTSFDVVIKLDLNYGCDLPLSPPSVPPEVRTELELMGARGVLIYSPQKVVFTDEGEYESTTWYANLVFAFRFDSFPLLDEWFNYVKEQDRAKLQARAERAAKRKEQANQRAEAAEIEERELYERLREKYGE